MSDAPAGQRGKEDDRFALILLLHFDQPNTQKHDVLLAPLFLLLSILQIVCFNHEEKKYTSK